MQKPKRLNCLAMLMLGIALMLSMQACASQPVQIRTEYVYIHDVPDLVFPIFPPPDSVTFNAETETVLMPLWYWQKIAEYKIDVDAIQAYVTQLRKIDEEAEK
ncbi:hypothetical protein AGMMS49944_15720 [Spirochaetia bacterium]|nr:hypothetical protein AGMMS49944_15720 [Spirochaetia bacterium]